MKKVLFILISIFVFTSSGAQSEKSKNTCHYLGLGYGLYSSVSNDWSMGMVISANYSFHKNLFYKIKYTYGDEFDFLERGETFHDIGLLVGDGYVKKYFNVFFSGGFGMTYFDSPVTQYEETVTTTILGFDRHVTEPVNEREKYRRPSALIETDFLFKPTENFGLGATLGINVNGKKNLCNFSVKFIVGKLR